MSDVSGASRVGKRRGLPFLGGLVSAALLYLAMEDNALRHVTWFALVPLLQTLHEARGSASRRFLHGFSFLAVLGVAFFRGDAAPALLGVQSGIFGVAAGPILRSERAVLRAVGLALLWTGLEVFRGPLCPFPGALMAGWLPLGSAVRPGSPESQLASLLGIHGLSLAAGLSSSLFWSVLVEARPWRQILYLAAGLAIPLLCRAHGLHSPPGETAQSRPADLTLVTSASNADSALAELTCKIPSTRNGMIIWPAISEAPPSSPAASGRLEATARDSASMVLTAAPASAGGKPSTALSADPSGRVNVATVHDGQTPVLVQAPQGLVGVGVEDGFDSPALAREATTRGAQILIGIASESGAWSEAAVRHRSTLQAYRAIENHRWLARASHRAADMIDPQGRAALWIHGGDWAGSGEAAWIEATTVYTRRGWWIEPGLLAAAGWALVSATIHWIAHRRRA